MDAIQCLKTRRSVRAYKPGQIDRDIIRDIVDCGRLAASAINIQPWQFIAVTDPHAVAKIANTTDHGKFMASASCCIAVFCENVKYYIEDGSAATQNILLAAHAHGLAGCWIAGDKKPYCPQIREMLGVPETYTLVSLIAVGYADSVSSPAKKPVDEVLHWETFNP